jgi:hypothetical protein
LSGTSFKHSGDVGDIIYAMPTMRYLGGGNLVIGRNEMTRQAMSPAIVSILKPLLLTQPYVHSVGMHYGEATTFNLDSWRYRSTDEYDSFRSLGMRHMIEYTHKDVAERELSRPWLLGIKPEKWERVIIHRSPRYHNPRFPWREILAKYHGKIGFIGLPFEFEDFLARHSLKPIPFYQPKNFLEAARIIRGSDLFIGNQSAPYAIAEGMKHNTIQETFCGSTDCVYRRRNAQFVISEKCELPEI